MAITFVQESSAIAMHNNSTGLTPGFTCNKGDVLILTWEGGGAAGASVVVNDSTNGNWTVIDHQDDATNGSMCCAFVQMSATVASPGPVFSVTCTTDPSVFGYIDQFTGFAGTATFDATAGSGQYVTHATTQAAMVANAQSFFANEILFAVMNPNQLFAVDPPSGWTELANIHRYYAIEATATNLGLNQTFSSAATYNVRTFGIYDAPAFLPLAVRQACVADSGGTSVLFQNGSFASATLAGSAILVIAKGSSIASNQFTSFADSINGSYQSLDSITDVTALGIFKAFLFPNAASIGTAQSLTINASQSEPHLGFVAFEIQGIPAAALAAHTVALQTIASTTTNAISSNQVQAGTGAAIAIGVSINTTGNNGASSHPNVGTGFTICPSPGGNFWSAFGGTQATAEFQTYTNPGGISATFTAQAASSDDYVTFIAVFNSIGGAFVPPFTLSQFFVNDQYIQM